MKMILGKMGIGLGIEELKSRIADREKELADLDKYEHLDKNQLKQKKQLEADNIEDRGLIASIKKEVKGLDDEIKEGDLSTAKEIAMLKNQIVGIDRIIEETKRAGGNPSRVDQLASLKNTNLKRIAELEKSL